METASLNFYNDPQFYSLMDVESQRSAKEVVPYILELTEPKSVIDVGCGLGSWLAVFRQHGVQDVLGVDLDSIDKNQLQIPQENFLPFDLNLEFRMDRQFDLAMSLEVVGHLSNSVAHQFVKSLTGLAPVVLFSAPIPLQGGPRQINEQWPDYWASFFRQEGYLVIDCLRQHFWHNENVKWWNQQNMLIFVREDRLDDYPRLKQELEHTPSERLSRVQSLVHPTLYLMRGQLEGVSLKLILASLPKLLIRTVKAQVVKRLPKP